MAIRWISVIKQPIRSPTNTAVRKIGPPSSRADSSWFLFFLPLPTLLPFISFFLFFLLSNPLFLCFFLLLLFYYYYYYYCHLLSSRDSFLLHCCIVRVPLITTTSPPPATTLLLVSSILCLCLHKMPYNTRRKSLSLPSLGIHLPSSSRRSPKSNHDDQQLPPPKKVKRSHDSPSLSPEPSRRLSGHLSPPPSPMDGAALGSKIDTEGINDDIVVGVIHQLEKTANRPHLVKKLAAVLVTLNDNVAKYVSLASAFFPTC